MTKRYRGLLARYKVLPLLLIIGAVFTMTCDRIIFDSLDNCERGVYLHLYEQTECASTPSYPADITALTFFVFDAGNKLTSVQELGATTLAPDHELFVRLPEPGSYTVVAWAHHGDTNLYDFSTLTPGETTPDKLYLTLKSGADLTGHRLYVGSSDIITVGETCNLLVQNKLNLREITNRVHITVKGLKRPGDYKLELLSGNHRYSCEGKVMHTEPLYSYPIRTGYTDTTLVGEVTMLLLDGYYHSVVNIKDAHTGEKIPFDEEMLGDSREFNLLGAILLAKGTAGYELMNPRCVNDFDVVIEALGCDCPSGCIAVGLTINNWSIHSYNFVAQ
ncbi:MAG: FimB/Mfa2 family fimbrial subunit [Bacteroidota bacterium]|nr:FimB/Mfa2 family fimbrial subunit [Bacteroidota bacterium]HHU97239.1 FimB/Mfa2 family fimbrial subunit [Petrimonas sp.]